MVNISNYRLVQQGGFTFLFVQARETSYCPICRVPLLERGWRQRVMIDSNGDKTALYIRRLCCHKCNRLHHELPDCLVPYKRHCAQTIEAVINGGAHTEFCARLKHRVRRWWKAVKKYFIGVIESLRHKHKIICGSPPAFAEIIRAVMNSNNWIFEKSLCTRSVDVA